MQERAIGTAAEQHLGGGRGERLGKCGKKDKDKQTILDRRTHFHLHGAWRGDKHIRYSSRRRKLGEYHW